MEEQRTKRVPKCGYCQNHGIKNPLRAHKRDCKFLDCSCKLCVNTRLRREHMADMQYIKRNGIVELERIQNEQDAQSKKKDIYHKIFNERMANKNKKRMMKDLKSGNSSQDALLLAETGSTSAISPTSFINDSSSLPQLATLANLSNLRAFTSANSLMTSNQSDSSNLEAQAALANLHSNRSYAGLFPNTTDNSLTSDQFLKAAKLLGIGLTSTPKSSNSTSITGASGSSLERSAFRNDDLDLNEISEFIDQLSIVNCLNNDEKMLNAAICILFNGIPLALLNPSNVADEIYSAFKQLSSTNVFR